MILLVLIIVAQAAAAAVLLWRNRAAPQASGRLLVHTEPSGARVVIDGSERGTTPLQIELPPGVYRGEVILGDRRREIAVDVGAGATVSQHLDLAPAGAAGAPSSGALDIRSRPSGALVSIDGEPKGSTPLVIPAVSPGVHHVVLTSGGNQVRETVKVEASATAQLLVTLPVAARGSGWLSVASAIPMSIVEDGRVIGTTATDRVMVPAGRHTLELVNEALGFKSSRTVQVEDGKTVVITPELPRGTVSVNALPWAEVWVRDRKLGTTPLANLSLPIGTYEVVFRHPSLGERRKGVTVAAGSPMRVSIDMRR